MRAAVRLLKSGGILYASFINMYANLVYAMKFAPEIIRDQDESSLAYMRALQARKPFSGFAFTQAHFACQQDILPFMARFPLETLHFFGQEGLCSPCEANLMSQPPEVVDAWIDLSVSLAEREELLSWAEHLMVIGRKL